MKDEMQHGNSQTKVTLKVTEIDNINIVSSEAVLEVSSFLTDARSKSSKLVVNSHVDSRLFWPSIIRR